MVCIKCGYKDIREVKINNHSFCSICSSFVPKSNMNFERYISEKIDWEILDTFRKYNNSRGENQKQGMLKSVTSGRPVSRAPFGYSILNSGLKINEDATTVNSIFRSYMNNEISLNSISKQFGFSLNGIKKILQNRAYIGEIKFGGQYHKSSHQPIVDIDVFYAVQRKLKKVLKSKNVQ